MNYPRNGVSDIGLIHPYILGLKYPSQIYSLGHATSHINAREKADTDVQCALNNHIERENQWTRKTSTIVESEQIYKEAKEQLNLTDIEHVGVSTTISKKLDVHNANILQQLHQL